MHLRTTSRLAAVAAPALAAALLLGACGADDSSASSKPTVTLAEGETSYATIAPETTTTTEPEVDPASLFDGDLIDYEVQAGDYPLKIVEDFNISLEDLEAANGWSEAASEFPGPGTVIKLPPDAEESDDDGDDGGEGDGDGDSDGGGDAEASGDECESRSYTLEPNDYPNLVATKFDVSKEALDQANAGTDGYTAFYVGLTIVIPPSDDC